MSSEELSPDEKIAVRCKCGKGYRVASKKAGKKITCKGCGEKVKVPGVRALSMSSRAGILLSVGIDPETAHRNWEEESSKAGSGTAAGKIWKCSRCTAPLNPDELKGAYIEGELVCSVCRAGLEDRREEREGKKRELKANEIAILSAPSPERAKRLGMMYGALFFVGSAGPLWAVAHVHGVLAVLLGALFALAGGWFVFRKHS